MREGEVKEGIVPLPPKSPLGHTPMKKAAAEPHSSATKPHWWAINPPVAAENIERSRKEQRAAREADLEPSVVAWNGKGISVPVHLFLCMASLVVAHQWNWYAKHVWNPNCKGLSDKNSEHMDSRPMNYRVVGSNWILLRCNRKRIGGCSPLHYTSSTSCSSKDPYRARAFGSVTLPPLLLPSPAW